MVFTYAGDLYVAPSAGGQATRLTSHEGMEIFARFSPDGNRIAFSGEYAGTRQVYVIPAAGGEPKQLTFYPDVGAMPPRGGYDHLPLDWTPDGEHIMVRTNRTPFGERVGRYYLVDPDGGLEVPLEIPEGATGATYDASGDRLVYNIKSREWRHWKRYRGGRQQDLWIYYLANSSSRRLTDFEGTDNFPLWVGDVIYFTSDRGEAQKLNLWAYDLGTDQVRQVTRFTEYDVLWPTRGQGGIVFQNGGYIHHLDPATGRTRKIDITVPGDRPYTSPYYRDVSDQIESFDVSPTARRVLFTARGELWTAPKEHGNIRNLSQTPGIREREGTWSPDGKWFAYLSDATGDYELYVRAADGSGEPRQLTRGGEAWIYGMEWSPDSERIAFADNLLRLRAVDVESGRVTEVARSTKNQLNDYAWSPDSEWIAYTDVNEAFMSSIHLYSFEGGRSVQVTGDMTDESSPAFDRKGRYLYFTSARDFDYGNEGFRSRIYLTTLSADAGDPFPPRSDEEPAATGEMAAEESGGGQESMADEGMRVDLDGIADRVTVLPGLSPGSYRGLVGLEDGLLYFSGGGVQKYSLESRDAQTIISGIQAYALTPDASQMAYRTRGGYGIVPLRPGQNNESGRLDLDGMEMRIDPKVEWMQIYHDAWLIMRDWFYDPDMHGVDWDAMYDRYEPMARAVTYRPDLDHVIAELIAEVNVGHAYVNSSPEAPSVERVGSGLLGAEFTADGDRYRISRIFPGENWHEEFRSPLTQPGIDIREGDYLIAIDGEEVTTDDNPYAFLVNKADRIVLVTVNDRPRTAGARTYEVDPVSSELGLRYQAWVKENERIVTELSGGRIGYIHLPNTSIPGHRELYEGFQPLHMKDALILDDRYNGGGFIPEGMAFMVGNRLLNYWARRHMDLYSQPFVVHLGPKAVLINGQSSSGGDAFPYYFKELDQGPLIGERTWGGLVGISGNPGFVDGSSIAVPQFAFVDSEGRWSVEGTGVSPDIEVLDRPEEIAAGREPMIERAVQYLLQELQKPRYQRPEAPPGPVRIPPR